MSDVDDVSVFWNNNAGFTVVPNILVRASMGIPPSDRLALFQLLSWVDGKATPPTATTRPVGHRTMAEYLGVSQRHVRRVLSRLADAGFISGERKVGPYRTAYEIHLDHIEKVVREEYEAIRVAKEDDEMRTYMSSSMRTSRSSSCGHIGPHDADIYVRPKKDTRNTPKKKQNERPADAGDFLTSLSTDWRSALRRARVEVLPATGEITQVLDGLGCREPESSVHDVEMLPGSFLIVWPTGRVTPVIGDDGTLRRYTGDGLRRINRFAGKCAHCGRKVGALAGLLYGTDSECASVSGWSLSNDGGLSWDPAA